MCTNPKKLNCVIRTLKLNCLSQLHLTISKRYKPFRHHNACAFFVEESLWLESVGIIKVLSSSQHRIDIHLNRSSRRYGVALYGYVTVIGKRNKKRVTINVIGPFFA